MTNVENAKNTPPVTPAPTAATTVSGSRHIALMSGLLSLRRSLRDVELAQHVAVIGDTVAPFMAPPDTDPAALRAADSLAVRPDDPAAVAEEIQRRWEEVGFSYFVFRCRLRRRSR